MKPEVEYGSNITMTSLLSQTMNKTRILEVREDDAEPANVASLSILVQLVMLGCTFIIGHFLRRNKVTIVPEAGAALLLGVLVGMIVRISNQENGFASWINFNEQFFFYFLLPPIILLEFEDEAVFGNFGAICSYAFLGTIISTFAVGVMMYLFGSLKWTDEMPFLVCLTFGALISATDPVTVLALFNELGVDANLYAYVFGESVLNDAVAIVMYRTVLGFVGGKVSKGGILSAFSYFIANFVGSFSIGSLCAIGSATVVKYGQMNDQGLGVLESSLVVLFPYASYMMADALELSGIVSILFAGIAMKHYTAPIMSPVAQTITTNFVQMLAKLSETFVFNYMGVAMFLEKQSWDSLGFTFFTIISIFIARALNVYPCSILVNKYRETTRQIPMNHQHALWYSGLRGAMAFALALQSVTDLPNNYGRIMLTSTLFTIFFTVLVVGGTTPFCLTYLKVEMSESNSAEHEPKEPMPTITRIDTPVDGSDEETGVDPSLGILERQKAKLQKKLRKLKNDADFATLDKKYIKPFFASPTGSEPTSPASPESDKVSHHDPMTLPTRTHERRSLVADAFYARIDTSPPAIRKPSKFLNTNTPHMGSSWPTAHRRSSTRELENFSDAAAIVVDSSDQQAKLIRQTSVPEVSEVNNKQDTDFTTNVVKGEKNSSWIFATKQFGFPAQSLTLNPDTTNTRQQKPSWSSDQPDSRENRSKQLTGGRSETDFAILDLS